MTTKIIWIFLVVSLCLNIIFICQKYHQNRVVAVPDGDSIQLSDGRRVRLLGIDAPERGRCMAEEAREKLSSFVLRKHVRLKDTVTDDYGRVLAIVIVGFDTLVNREMLAAGLARNTFSAEKDYAPTLKQAYEEAKSANRGIFLLCAGPQHPEIVRSKVTSVTAPKFIMCQPATIMHKLSWTKPSATGGFVQKRKRSRQDLLVLPGADELPVFV